MLMGAKLAELANLARQAWRNLAVAMAQGQRNIQHSQKFSCYAKPMKFSILKL